MANISAYLSNSLLAHAVGKTSYTFPTVTAVLYTTNPTLPGADAGGALSGVQTSYTSYAPVSVTWGSAASEGIANSATVTFPTVGATAGAAITGWGLLDGSGKVLFAGTCAITPTTGMIPQINIGSMTVGLT
jgi:hypothetical protein